MRTLATRLPFFYGWVVVVVVFFALVAAYGVQFSFGVFLPELEREFGWSRAQITLPFAIYTFNYSAFSILSGPLTDRYGPRVVLAGGALLLGGAYLLMSRVTELWHLYLLLPIVAGLGMSSTNVPSNATVVRWFVRLRGTALGITGSGQGAGTMVVPLLAGALIAGLGWRSAYVVLGLMVLAVMGVGALLSVREPEQLGLHPDGDTPRPLEQAMRPPEEPSWRLGEAVRTGTFWLFIVMFMGTFLFIFIPSVHLGAHVLDLGAAPGRAVWAISVVGFGVALGRFLLGALSDRVGRRPTTAIAFGLQAFAFTMLAAVPVVPLVYPLGFIGGLGYGGVSVMWPALIGDIFGRRYAGALIGAVFATSGSTAAVGPYLASVIHDTFGSYFWAFVMGAGGNLFAMVLLTRLRRPRGVSWSPTAGRGGRPSSGRSG